MSARDPDARFVVFILQQMAANADWIRATAERHGVRDARALLELAHEHAVTAAKLVAYALRCPAVRPHIVFDGDACVMCKASPATGECPGPVGEWSASSTRGTP